MIAHTGSWPVSRQADEAPRLCAHIGHRAKARRDRQYVERAHDRDQNDYMLHMLGSDTAASALIADLARRLAWLFRCFRLRY